MGSRVTAYEPEPVIALNADAAPDPALVYAPQYNIRAFGLERLHPFDGSKYGRCMKQLKQWNVPLAGRVHRPRPVGHSLIRTTHSSEYLASLRSSRVVAGILEIPQLARLPMPVLDWLIPRRMRWACGGTVLATTLAQKHRVTVNLGGGYHHASRNRGEGFCMYSDIAMAVRVARGEFGMRRVMLVDLDAHQGNGVERIFAEDRDVAVFDMYNAAIYPNDIAARDAIRWDFPLTPGFSDEPYLKLLRHHLPLAISDFDPELIIYNAGTDVVADDPLGGLGLSDGAVLQRDQFVISEAIDRGIPLVMLTSGGYTQRSYLLIATTLRWLLTDWPRSFV